MRTDYHLFDEEGFLEDEYFIRSVRDRTPDSDEFWNKWEALSPPNLGDYQRARKELQIIFSAKRFIPEESVGQEVYEKILQSIENHDQQTEKTRKVVKLYKQRVLSWITAASILLIFAAGYYFLFDVEDKKLSAKKETIEVLPPGSNRAVLILANGEEIYLDSAVNGNLATQGNSSVIQLSNGLISYRESISVPAGEVLFNTISTPRGGQYQIELADGSKVWLNAASSLHFPVQFSGSSRVVEVTGEAYFEIAENKTMPFKVKMPGSGTIEVTGTRFNVMCYEGESAAQTTLLEGAVKVLSGDNEVRLIPGQQIIMDQNTGQLTLHNQVNEEAVMAWKNGKFYFNEVPIESVMNQIARWYDVEVEYNGKVKKTFAGSISRNVSAPNVLKILEATGGVHFTVQGKKIIVSP